MELRASPDASNDLTVSPSRWPTAGIRYTFIVGLLSLMLAIQLTGMAMLSLQSKKYFDELFHLGSTALREQREAALSLTESTAEIKRDPSIKQARDQQH